MFNNKQQQIRMKARINKTSKEFNQKYFKNRSVEKNALAISSNQSSPIKSFDHVIKKFIPLIMILKKINPQIKILVGKIF